MSLSLLEGKGGMIYAFGDYELDTDRVELRHQGTLLSLEPQVFDILAYLIHHHNRVVTRQELLAQVWPTHFVSEGTLYQRLMQARQVVGDSGQLQRVITTVRSKGYRFVAPVETYHETYHEAASNPQVAHLTDTSPRVREPAQFSEATEVKSIEAPHVLSDLLEEQKLVTIVYGTLSQTIGMAGSLGVDVLRRVQKAFLSLVQEEMRQYQGDCQFISHDVFVVVFGAPQAHEDHARRALLAALNLQQRLHDPYIDPAIRHPVSFAVRLGVHAGQVIWGGHQGAPRNLGIVVGEAKDLAMRLQAFAEPGQLLVSESTLRLVHGQVHSQMVGPIHVPGNTTPVIAHMVYALGPWQSFMGQPGHRQLSRFVGRERELATLRGLLAHTQANLGQVVGVMGEPGIGKSRLLYEYSQHLTDQPVTYVESHCLSYGHATPYLPIVDILRQLCGITGIDTPETMTTKVQQSLDRIGLNPDVMSPYVLQFLGVQTGTEILAELAPLTLKRRTFDALRLFVLHHSQRQTLIMAVENLHWIDATSEAWLATLIEHLAGSSLLLVLTYRPGYRPPWIDKSYVTQISLPQLAFGDSLAVVQSVLRAKQVLEPLLMEIVEKAAGNPFFLEELALTVAEQGDGSTPSVVPDTVQAVLSARMDRLSPEAKHLLQLASVMGRDIPLPLLYDVAEVPKAVINRSLMHLQAAEFLYETRLFPEQVYTFKHALTHEVAYGSLLPGQRQTLHARIVEALESLGGNRVADWVERLAHHAVRGEVWDKAVAYCRRAGDKAAARSAHREAVTYFQQALLALDQLSECRETCEQAIDLRLILRGSLHPLGELRQIVDHLSEAETLALALEDQHRLGQVWARMGHYAWTIGDQERFIELSQRVLSTAKAFEDTDLQVLARYYLGAANHAMGNYPRTMDYLQRVVAALENDPLWQPVGLRTLISVASRAYIAWSRAEMGSFVEGGHIGEEGIRIAEASEQPFSGLVIYVAVGLAYLRKGELDRAMVVLERGLELCQSADIPFWLPALQGALGFAHALAGRVTTALALLEQAVEQGPAMGIMVFQPLWLTCLAEVYLLGDRLEEAGAFGERALALSRHQKERVHEAYASKLLGDIHAHCDRLDIDLALAHYQQALTLAKELGTRPLQTHCHHSLGTLYSQSGQTEQARAELSTAIEMYRDMEMTFWLPDTEVALAKVG